MNKPFKETKVGQFLQSKGFSAAIDAVGTVVPGFSLINTVKDLVIGDPKWKTLSEGERQIFLQLHEEYLQELDLILKDVANARSREIELVKAGKKDWMMSVVILTGLILFIAMIAITVFVPIPGEMMETFQDLKTTVRDVALMIFAYYVGSSRGSSKKTDLLSKK